MCIRDSHQGTVDKNKNTENMVQALQLLANDIKKVHKTHVLYVDDGPALTSAKPGCLTLQCADTTKGGALTPIADGQIENPANLPDVFRYMGYTRFYLSQQLVLAMLYNIIAIPLMAGALCFLFMPAPWMGAILMNLFSMGLIYRSKQLTSYLDNLVLPSDALSYKNAEQRAETFAGDNIQKSMGNKGVGGTFEIPKEYSQALS